MRPYSRGLLPLIAIATAGCASLDERLAREVDEVDASVQERIGAEPNVAPGAADDGSLDAQIAALLEAELTEETAVRIALLNNRDVRAAYEELGISAAGLVQAGLLTNPIFSANAKFFGGGTEVELGLTQSFLDFFFLPLRKRFAEFQLEATKAAVTRELVRLAHDIRRAFVTVRFAQQLVEMRRQVLEAAEASYDLMRRLHQAGNVTDPQLTAEEAAFSRAKLDLAAAESNLLDAREPLNALLGLWGDAIQWRVAGRLSEAVDEGIDVDSVESRAVAASLDLAENRALIDAEAQRVGLSSWETLLPVLELGPVAKKERDSSEFGVGPGLLSSIPLFDRGQARRAAAQFTLRYAIHRHVQLGVEIRAAARALRERMLALRERIVFFRSTHLPLRARLVRETLQNYNAMQIGVFDLLIARQQEIDAGRDYLETLRDAWFARLDLQELLAGRWSVPTGASAAPTGHDTWSRMPTGH